MELNLRKYDLEPLIKLARETDSEVEVSMKLEKNAAVEIRIIVTPL